MNIQTDLKINEAFRSLIPPLSDHELAGLEEDIKHFGCQSPLTIWNGTIIDGHHRYAICKKHGLPFKTEERQFDSEKDVEIWMLRNQFNRRNLTDFIRGELALALKSRLREQAVENSSSNNRYTQTTEKEFVNDCQNFDSRKNEQGCEKDQKDWNENRVDAQVGRLAGISREQVRKIEKLKAVSDDKGLEALRAGTVSIHKAFREARKQERQQTLQTTEFPQGKYRVIYADPPWDYKTGDNSKNTSDPEIHYELMSIEDICNMPVRDIADENAVLFLWTTSYHIFESKKVLDAWNFNYKSMFIWDKVKHNMGCYNSVRHEILLIATKGSCVPDNVELIDSVQTIERTRHSEKPDRFREIIDTLYKHGNKIELFARKKVEGWEGFGNEVA